MKAFVLFFVVAVTQQFPTTLRGRVIDAGGKPIAGVKAQRTNADEVITDANGEFTVAKPGHFIRFSAIGYRPATLNTKELVRRPEVTLMRDAQGQWIPPMCPPGGSGRVIRGTWMQLTVSGSVKIGKGSDVDYQTNVVCLGRACLQHGFGSNWSAGFPPQATLVEWNQIQERDVEKNTDPAFQAFEYRARRNDGTFTRFIGMYGETVSYDRASKETADYFDRIMDSLCWLQHP